MAKMTLLELVQSVLSSMDDDNVNAIGETESSEQVALVCQEVYTELMESSDWPHLQLIAELDSVSDVTMPTYLKIPESIGDINRIDYNIDKVGATNVKFEEVTYMEPWEFMDLILSRNTSNSEITSYDTPEGIPLFIQTDKAPERWTSFDDEFIVMDSFDSAVENTLQGSKTITIAKKETAWTHTDTGEPDLPDNMFPLYLARCKVKCHGYFRQTVNSLDEQEARRGKSRFKQTGQRTREKHTRKYYGR